MWLSYPNSSAKSIGRSAAEESAGLSALAPPALADAAPFLNRARELAGLQAALDHTLAGHGRLLLVSGEGGIGKTRLVDELTTRAVAARHDGGARAAWIVWGRCWDSGGAPSLWPWVSVVRALIAGRDPDQLRVQLGSAAPWLGQFTPEILEALPELETAGATDSEQSRFVLFDALTGFLRRVAGEQPLVIVLDDIHAADQLSLLALLFVARQLGEMPVLVVATHREAEVQRSPRLSSLFAKLQRAGERLPLSGLGPDEIGQLIEHRSGAGSGGAAAQKLHRATGGNPFFADEILRVLGTEGRLEVLDQASLPLPVPMSVRALIEQRLEAMPSSTQSTLRSAAVIGDAFSLGTLGQVSGRTRRELLEELEDSVAARLIEPRVAEVAGYQFAHDLIRETAYTSIPAIERAREHAAVAEALQRRYAGATDRHLEELAHHFLESLPVGDPLTAVEYAHRAAAAAQRQFAHERADRLYAAALEALELVDGLGDADRFRRRAQLLLGLGRAQLRTGDARARETLLEAAAAARTAGAAALLADVAAAFGAFALSPGLVDPELTGLLEEALSAVPAQDSATRATLLARLARALYWSREEGRRREMIEGAIAMARRLDDPEALAVVLGNCILASRGPDTAELELAWIYELLALQRGPGELFVLARSIEIDLLLERGAFAAADAAIDSLEAQAARLRDVRARPYAWLHRARRATIEGRWDDANALLARVDAIAGDLEDTTVPILARGARFMLAVLSGRADEFEAPLRQVVEQLPEMAVWRAGLAFVYATTGQVAEARALLERLAVGGLSSIARDNVWLMTVALMAEACALVSDTRHGPMLRRALAPFAREMVVSPVNGYIGPVTRYLGLLDALLGDRTAGTEQLRHALDTVRHQRARPLEATIALDLARALASDGNGTAEETTALLDEAERLAAELGIPSLAGRVADTRRDLIARPPLSTPRPRAALPLAARLTREGEMWSFIYAGRLTHVRDTKGVRHLATLLARPGVEFHALDLAAGAASRSGAGHAGTRGGLSLVAGAGTGPALDDQAKAAYRLRLEDLRDELEQAERWRDPERASRAREEIDLIARELAAAVGLGGRDRPQASEAERARVNVTRAIKSAIRRLAEQDGDLGAELVATIRTGLFCCYEPDRRHPVSWEVHVG